MKNIFTQIGNFIRRIIDCFYTPFRRIVPLQIFRYAVSGGLNLLFDWVLYFFIYNYILHQQEFHIGNFLAFKPHIAAMILKFPVTLFSGFLLQKYVTFSYAIDTRGRIQLLKYLSVVLVNLLFNYAGLKFLVEFIKVFPSIANVIVSLFCTLVSYIAQNKFTFKVKQ
ncbi:MAG: GtrA family protein [Prevotellaceae bacterium]|jgi:putative flippase GtrA|nr:GtrA family protein [Prevotellaceae bacterium]